MPSPPKQSIKPAFTAREHIPMICLWILSFSPMFLFSQNQRKKMTAITASSSIKVDGILSEEDWKKAPVASDFIESRPVSGKPSSQELRTEIRIVYDNTALYIGATMHDISADSIAKEISPRDGVGNADFIMVLLDTYNTGINGFGFLVTTTNSQYDARYSNDNNGEDASWNAVWESAVKISGTDWTAEIKIPYSALRFAKKDVQQWGINFLRRRIVTQQDYFWNFVDPVKAGFVNQWGLLEGIKNIKPPLRLSFTPYLSTYVDHYPYNSPGISNTSRYVNGGMDVKYGINESFTLDMTLIPDFGQVQSDNKILNLTPFEVKYNEYRSFFTEGTELFNKGNLFYSRRIGGTPLYHDSVQNNVPANQVLLSNPTESKLINATKLSGRTKKGLGIGFFNALTANTYAELTDDLGKNYSVKTAPLTNYNIVVLDQSLKNNSSITFINTNVQRGNSAYNANVSSGLFNLFSKNNTYNLNGQFAFSHLDGPQMHQQNGTYYTLSGGKSSGKFSAIYTHTVLDDKYNPNDLGILFNNNEIDDNLNLNYSIVKPSHWFTSLYTGGFATYSQHYLPRTWQNFITAFYVNVNLKNLWRVNINGDWNPWTGNDYFEPRTTGRVYRAPSTWSLNFNLNTNRSRKYTVFSAFSFRKRNLFGGYGIDLTYDQNYRFSNRFAVEHTLNYSPRYNNAGYAIGLTADSVIFGRRNVNTVENIIFAKFNFNSHVGITLRVRHYYSSVDYKEYFLLGNDGNLAKTSYNSNNNINFNLFNVDGVFNWWFAPGSQLSIAWKNMIQSSNDVVVTNYIKNLSNTVNAPQQNSYSIKVLYYIDYISFRSKKPVKE